MHYSSENWGSCWKTSYVRNYAVAVGFYDHPSTELISNWSYILRSDRDFQCLILWSFHPLTCLAIYIWFIAVHWSTFLPLAPNPICLYTTSASFGSHPLSHTVPQNPSIQISTLPSLSLSPPTRRRFPELHSGWEVVFPWQITLTTSEER